ncbi:SHOCT domain-containing protein [Nocardioides sp.]|uniref:SHOCT domain-containing protein n=1 Tax=Nocardioides sp. TaxID=35761 RepID=UPI003784B83A
MLEAMVFLVPRQLRMTGMTGDVPYYGGRMTPAQAYAASHRTQPPPPPPPPPTAPPAPRRDPVEALDELLESGHLTQEEYDDLRARVERS